MNVRNVLLIAEILAFGASNPLTSPTQIALLARLVAGIYNTRTPLLEHITIFLCGAYAIVSVLTKTNKRKVKGERYLSIGFFLTDLIFGLTFLYNEIVPGPGYFISIALSLVSATFLKLKID